MNERFPSTKIEEKYFSTNFYFNDVKCEWNEVQLVFSERNDVIFQF